MDSDDAELFRRAISGTKPLRPDERAPAARRKPRPIARFSKADEQQALAESLEPDIETLEASTPESLRFHRPHVGKRTMRRLARGHYAVQAEIDLHGMTVAEARPRLEAFIDDCLLRGYLCVRIIHGKGRGSGTRGPVLKQAVNGWLRRLKKVLAFVSARQVDGGTGAVYVLLDDA